MIDAKQLADAFANNVQSIKTQTDGLTHADSLLQPPFRSNCLNWVVGHIVASRNQILRALGQKPVLNEAQAARYGYGSPPVCTDGEDVLKLEELLAALERAQEGIAAGLQHITAEELAKEMRFAGRTMTVAECVFFLYSHETYHTGQTELLRQLAATNDL